MHQKYKLKNDFANLTLLQNCALKSHDNNNNDFSALEEAPWSTLLMRGMTPMGKDKTGVQASTHIRIYSHILSNEETTALKPKNPIITIIRILLVIFTQGFWLIPELGYYIYQKILKSKKAKTTAKEKATPIAEIKRNGLFKKAAIFTNSNEPIFTINKSTAKEYILTNTPKDQTVSAQIERAPGFTIKMRSPITQITFKLNDNEIATYNQQNELEIKFDTPEPVRLAILSILICETCKFNQTT